MKKMMGLVLSAALFFGVSNGEVVEKQERNNVFYAVKDIKPGG